MKTRHGFVSNSSSTSFCIYGVCFDDIEELESNLIEKIERIEDDWSNGVEPFEDFFQKQGLDTYSGSDDFYLYIGKDYTSIGDDETGKEFKDNIKSRIRLLFKDPSKLEFQSFTEDIY